MDNNDTRDYRLNGPENAAWSYEAPYDEMLAIRGHLAFYPDRFAIETS